MVLRTARTLTVTGCRFDPQGQPTTGTITQNTLRNDGALLADATGHGVRVDLQLATGQLIDDGFGTTENRTTVVATPKPPTAATIRTALPWATDLPATGWPMRCGAMTG